MLLFAEIENSILKFIWMKERPLHGKKSNAFSITFPVFKLHCIVVVTKTVLHWPENRHEEQWNRIG
jgi:hypothetical protein